MTKGNFATRGREKRTKAFTRFARDSRKWLVTLEHSPPYAVVETSSLYLDDNALGGSDGPLIGAMGFMPWHSTHVAVDCFHMAMKARACQIRGDYGPLALLRTSLFAALKTIYLLSPTDPDERQIRVLALMRKELREVSTSTEEVLALRRAVYGALSESQANAADSGPPGDDVEQSQFEWQQRLQDAVDTKSAALGLASSDLKPRKRGHPSDTQIVISGADALVQHLSRPHLSHAVVHEWRALSAAAHAYSWDSQLTQGHASPPGGPNPDLTDERLFRAADLTAAAAQRAVRLWQAYCAPSLGANQHAT